MAEKYVEIIDQFETKIPYTRHIHVLFRSGVDIPCNPPYITGKTDHTWLLSRVPLPKITNKTAWEKKLGLSLLPL